MVGAPLRTVAPRRVPTRSCVVCRTARPKRELLRIVRTPDGRIVLDETGRLAGRGAYVCDQDECRTLAIKKGALGRALKTPLTDELRDGLVGRATTDMIIEGGARGQE